MAENTYTCETIGNSAHILVNGVVHIAFKQDNLKGFQAWKMGRGKNRFCVELYFVSDGMKWTMELEYESTEMSKAITDILKTFV